jgi:hypothetical protein
MCEQHDVEIDLLRVELEGLYGEKAQVSRLVEIMQTGEDRLVGELENAQQELFELLMLTRKVDQTYGPFQAFDDVLRRPDPVRSDRPRGVTRVGARYL